MVTTLRVSYEVSIRKACSILQFSRSTNNYQSRKDRQDELRMRIRDIALARVHYGYRRITIALRRQGWEVNHKRVYRIYSEECLNLKRNKPKRHVTFKRRKDRPDPTGPNQVWAMDFMADQLFDGRRFRILTLVDTYNRECLALKSGQSIKGKDVVDQMERLRSEQKLPDRICVDNGSEFKSKVMDHWAYMHNVELDFSRPGRPTDNAMIEAFNSRFRQECLNEHWFLDLDDAKKIIKAWRMDYNTERPHSALGNVPPAEFGPPASGVPMGGSLHPGKPGRKTTLTEDFSQG